MISGQSLSAKPLTGFPSGVWISTAAGSTAAIRAAGGRVMPPRSKRLQFLVREPLPEHRAVAGQQSTITRGFITENESLTIRSKTDTAKLFVDGPHVVFPVEFGSVIEDADRAAVAALANDIEHALLLVAVADGQNLRPALSHAV